MHIISFEISENLQNSVYNGIRMGQRGAKAELMEKSEKLERLFLLYEQPMYRVAYSILNSVWQAEDAVSLAFVKLSENIDRIDEPESEKTKRYVKKIIRNTSIDLYRKNKRESKYLKSSDEKYESVRDDKVEMDFHNIENEGNFKSLLDGLSEKYKEILMMRCVQGLMNIL